MRRPSRAAPRGRSGDRRGPPESPRASPPRPVPVDGAAALTTDAWYTLIYLVPPARAALHRERLEIWAEPLVRAGKSRSEALALLRRHALWKETLEAQGRTLPLREQVAWLEQEAKVTLDADAISDGLDRALLRADIRPSPGASRVLRELARAGVPLGVVSNVVNETGEAARTMLDRAGLLPFFRAVYLSCEHAWSKPRPEPFRTVAAFLGVPVERVVHIGDLRYDLDGARRAGARRLLFVGYSDWNRYLPGWPGDPVRKRERCVDSWSELPEVWEGLANDPPRNLSARRRRTSR